MALPAVNFDQIADVSSEAIQLYGTPTQFIEFGGAGPRDIKTIVYLDKQAAVLLQDADTVPALALLDPQDFQPPHRVAQQFDQLEIVADGVVELWTLAADPHPVYAAHRLPIFIVELKRA